MRYKLLAAVIVCAALGVAVAKPVFTNGVQMSPQSTSPIQSGQAGLYNHSDQASWQQSNGNVCTMSENPVLLGPVQQTGQMNLSGTVRGDGGIISTLISNLFGSANMSLDEANGITIQHHDRVTGSSSLIRLDNGLPLLIEGNSTNATNGVSVWIVSQGAFNAGPGAAQVQIGGNASGRAIFLGIAPDNSSSEYCMIAENIATDSAVNPGDVLVWSSSHSVAEASAVANQINHAGIGFTTTSGGGQKTRVCRLGQARANAEAGIAVGDTVVTSAAHAGWVDKNNSAPAGARIGIAVEATGAEVSGKVLVDVRP